MVKWLWPFILMKVQANKDSLKLTLIRQFTNKYSVKYEAKKFPGKSPMGENWGLWDYFLGGPISYEDTKVIGTSESKTSVGHEEQNQIKKVLRENLPTMY